MGEIPREPRIPNIKVPLVDLQTGAMTPAWYRYFSGENDGVSSVNSGVALASAAAAAAQATADAAAQQASDIGSEALPFSASISPASATGSGKVNITTNSVTATPSGGTGPYTYAWTYVSGDAVTVLSPTAASTQFRSNISAGGVYRCTITDSLAATATATVGVSITSTSE